MAISEKRLAKIKKDREKYLADPKIKKVMQRAKAFFEKVDAGAKLIKI